MGEIFIYNDVVRCPECKGTGNKTCPICKGKGIDYRTALFGKPCPPTIPCERCRGTGYLRIK